MIEGTTRFDFILRVIQARDLNPDPEIMKLIEDFHDAFERGFKFACKLRENEMFHELGELLRLTLMNDQEEIKNLNEKIKRAKALKEKT